MKFSIKKLTGLALSFTLAATLNSCESVLNELPFSEISDDQFWKTNADAESGVTAIYDAMQKTYSFKHYYWGEFRADNYIASQTPNGESLELLNNTLQTSNSGSTRWNDLYLMIGRANLAIEKIPQIPGFNKNLLAEAHILRSYAYFDAVRVWGNVPLFEEAITGLDQELQRPQTDGSKILTDIVIPDMLEAERLMSIPANPFRFSKGSILAFQAHVYMHLKQYDKAKVALDKIVALKAYSLTRTRDAWDKLFLNDPDEGGKFMTGPELMMSIRFDLTEDNDRPGIYSLFFAGLPSFYISPLLENKWRTKFPVDSLAWVTKYPDFTPKYKKLDGTTLYGDYRYFDSRESGREIGEARVAKYTKTNINRNFDDSNINLFRYAGILTLLAEAENQLGNSAKAVALMNELRVARELPTVDAARFTTKAQLENFILDERQLEFLGEGKRWWDLRRTEKAVEVMSPINGQTKATLLFPIFQKHLIDNPKLTQTPGY